LKKTVLTFGLISGVVIAVLTFTTLLFADRIGFDRGVIVGYTTMLMAFLLVFFGIKSYRDNVGNGEITFWKGFQIGILITLITCACYVITWEILYYNFLPDFAEKYTNHIVERARANGATPQQIAQQVEEMKKMKALLDNPWLAMPVIFIGEPLPVGLVMTLLSAAILRRRRKTPEVAVTTANAQ
jgi:amino acid transporter